MTEEQIIHKALDNLQSATKIQGHWSRKGKNELDGKLKFIIEGEVFNFNAAIKKELRNHILPQIFKLNEENKPFILVAARLFPEIKNQLRDNNVAYLEANGNFYLKDGNKWLWLDANRSLKIEQEHRNRAFTKTGLKVLFEFLTNDSLMNLPYRQIAEQTGTSIGNITHIINGLKQEGFILPIDKNTIKIKDYKSLAIKWAEAYTLALKPLLKIGTFRFLKENDFWDWKNLRLQQGKTLWGAEPAADLLTNYLRPAELTLYTEESRNEIIKNYKLIPDDKGNVNVYKKFWRQEAANAATVPPLLVYADLITMADRRSFETAQKIYDEYLQTEL